MSRGKIGGLRESQPVVYDQERVYTGDTDQEVLQPEEYQVDYQATFEANKASRNEHIKKAIWGAPAHLVGKAMEDSTIMSGSYDMKPGRDFAKLSGALLAGVLAQPAVGAYHSTQAIKDGIDAKQNQRKARKEQNDE